MNREKALEAMGTRMREEFLPDLDLMIYEASVALDALLGMEGVKVMPWCFEHNSPQHAGPYRDSGWWRIDMVTVLPGDLRDTEDN